MYKKLKDRFTVFYDCDDTLVMWKDKAEIENNPNVVYIKSDFKEPFPVLVHLDHVEQIKNHKRRGHQVVVWSYGGADYAEDIVKGLKLEEYVDVICCKPDIAYDDLPKEAIIQRQEYKPFKDIK